MPNSFISRIQSKIKSDGMGVFFGILGSRIFGLIREKVLAYYLGTSWQADAFRAALRIPNFLQNLLGEGALTSSFVPVYAQLDQSGKISEAKLVAQKVLLYLFFSSLFLVGMGLIWTQELVNFLAYGFDEPTRTLTAVYTKIIFAGTGILVISAWCLGVLNAHRKYLVSYSAPMAWNIIIIIGLFLTPLWVQLFTVDPTNLNEIGLIASWSFLFGCLAQLVVQIPFFFSKFSTRSEILPDQKLIKNSLKKILNHFFNSVFSRGASQISSFSDTFLASLFPSGSFATLSLSQTIYLLPISLIGMSYSVPQLTDTSRAHTIDPDFLKNFEEKLIHLLKLGALWTVFIFLLGDLVCWLIYSGGQIQDISNIALVLKIMSLSVIPALLNRMLTATFFGLSNTKTPTRLSLLTISITIILGWIFASFNPLTQIGEASILLLGYASFFGASIQFISLYILLRKVLPINLKILWYSLSLLTMALVGSLFFVYLKIP